MEVNVRAVVLLCLMLALGGVFASSFSMRSVERDPARSVALFDVPIAEAGVLFASLLDAPAHPARTPPAHLSGATFVIDQIITPALAERVLLMPDTSLAFVELDSVGGDVRSAIAIANRLREAKAHTHVRAGAICFSACTVIFQGGIVRSAESDALFLLHYAVQVSDDPELAQVGSIWGTVSLVEAMIDLGADPGIYDQMPGFGDWLLSATQAIDVGMVQHIGSPVDVSGRLSSERSPA